MALELRAAIACSIEGTAEEASSSCNALQTGVTLGVFAWALSSRNLVEARNLAFSVLVFGELFRAFAARSATRLFWEVGIFSNLQVLGVVAVSVLLQLAIHHLPFAQQLFQIGELSLADCVLVFGLGLVPVSVLELSKLLRRSRPVRARPAGVAS